MQSLKRFWNYCRQDGVLPLWAVNIRRFGSKFRWHYWKRHLLILYIVKARLIVLRWFNSDRVTDADPFKIIWVNPEEIQQKRKGSYSHKWGLVTEENWESTSIEHIERYKAIKQHFVDGRNHPAIRKSKEKLYQSMKMNGYIPQWRLRTLAQLLPFHYRDFEIAVDITAEGDMHWSGWGANRLFIAKILGIEEIAVQIRVRHRRWQEIRNEVRKAETADELSDRATRYLDHPDLGDIVP